MRRRRELSLGHGPIHTEMCCRARQLTRSVHPAPSPQPLPSHTPTFVMAFSLALLLTMSASMPLPTAGAAPFPASLEAWAQRYGSSYGYECDMRVASCALASCTPSVELELPEPTSCHAWQCVMSCARQHSDCLQPWKDLCEELHEQPPPLGPGSNCSATGADSCCVKCSSSSAGRLLPLLSVTAAAAVLTFLRA